MRWNEAIAIGMGIRASQNLDHMALKSVAESTADVLAALTTNFDRQKYLSLVLYGRVPNE